MGKIGDLWVRLGLKSDDFSRGISEATSKTESFGKQVGRMAGTAVAGIASITAVVAALVRGLGDAIKVAMQFEKANSTLASVLGTSKREIQDMAEAAMDLGRRTKYTSTEVTQLQTELAKLGFGKGQIKDMEESILKFAAAVDTDLASAAAFAGASLRSFNLQADEMPALLDVLAKSCTTTALDFSKLATAFPIAASTAYSFGMNAKQLAAMLGVLANRGIDASSAATALRNIFLDAANADSKLAATTGISLKNYKDVLAALKALAEAGGDLTEIAGAGTQRTISAIAALADETEVIQGLEEAFANCAGTVDQMYVTATDNAASASDALKSAFEGLQLKLRGLDDPLKNFKLRLADILNTITDILGSPFWDSKFWQFWSNGVKKAAEAALGRISPLVKALREIKGISNIFGGRKNDEAPAEEPQDTSVYFSTEYTDNPDFVGPIQPKKKTPHKLNEDEIEALAKAAKERRQRELENIRETAAALVAEEEEYLAEDAAAIAEWERQHGIIHDTLDPVTRDLINFVDSMNLAEEALQGMLDAGLDHCTALAEAGVDKLESFKESAISLAESLQRELISAFDDLAEAIGSGDFDSSDLVKSLLNPLAEFAVSLGTIVLMSGDALAALKAAITDLFGTGAAGAIAAGGALIAIGLAAKAGIAAIGRGGSAASSVTSVGASSLETGAAGVMSSELTVHVDGVVKGSDIIITGQNQINEWGK